MLFKIKRLKNLFMALITEAVNENKELVEIKIKVIKEVDTL